MQPANYIDEQIRSQQAQHQSVTDTYQWLTRYIFVPFRDRDLSIKLQGDFGIVGSIRAGYIVPITRRNQWIMDYDEVKRVPTFSDGTYHPSSIGVSTMKPQERMPAKVVEAIFRIFNQHHGTDSNQDNGICEIEVLRGSDDMGLLRELNDFCLPHFDDDGNSIAYETARAQMERLTMAASIAPTPLYAAVAERLLESTRQSLAWANWHYANLEADMEDKAKTGKDRLSPLDQAVCKWIEKQPPRFRSNLTGEAQPVVVQSGQVATPAKPTVQCFDCGAEANLLPDGSYPKKGCVACGSVSFGREEEKPKELVVESFDPNNPMGEAVTTKLAQKQADAKTRNGK